LIFTNFCSRRVRKTGIPAGGQKFISGDDAQTPLPFCPPAFRAEGAPTCLVVRRGSRDFVDKKF